MPILRSQLLPERVLTIEASAEPCELQRNLDNRAQMAAKVVLPPTLKMNDILYLLPVTTVSSTSAAAAVR